MHPVFYRIILFALVCFFSNINAAPIKHTARISDISITKKISTQFEEKLNLTPPKITVTTQQGIVKLTGEVRDKQALVDTFWIARTTPGVKMVDVDDLQIKHHNTMLSDAYITAKVETAVLKAKILDDESIPLVGINASTINGIVTIMGEVKRQESINAILKRAHAIRGVKKIVSNLRVKENTPTSVKP